MKAARAKKARLEGQQEAEAVMVENAPEIASTPQTTNLEMPMLYSAEANLF